MRIVVRIKKTYNLSNTNHNHPVLNAAKNLGRACAPPPWLQLGYHPSSTWRAAGCCRRLLSNLAAEGRACLGWLGWVGMVDACWCMIWWCILMYVDVWWLMIHDASWRFIVVNLDVMCIVGGWWLLLCWLCVLLLGTHGKPNWLKGARFFLINILIVVILYFRRMHHLQFLLLFTQLLAC